MKGFIEITDISIASDPTATYNNEGLVLINIASILYASPYCNTKTIIYLNDASQVKAHGKTSIFICEEDYATVKKTIEDNQI